jgi:hypothetical protein
MISNRTVIMLAFLAVLSVRLMAAPQPALTWPPALPGGKDVVTHTAPEFLQAPATASLKPGVSVAKAAPTIDFLFYPEQTYEGNPWSAWGDSLVAMNGKYYSSIGDHGAVGGKSVPGNAFVFEYDPGAKRLKTVLDVRKLLQPAADQYCPGKIHSRLDQGRDGWIYFSTHRGSGAATSDKYGYKGDWVLRYNPETGAGEVVVQGPVPKHCIPASVLDPDRLVFYGGTAAGADATGKGVRFFAYDIANRKLLYDGPNGCSRYFILARSTGRVYFERTAEGDKNTGELVRYDPATPEQAPVAVGRCPGLRAATQETPQGFVYAVSTGQGGGEATLWRFDVKTEKIEVLGPVAVASQQYITTIDADPSGRYLYYVPGAHGGSEKDGCPVAQYDVESKTRKILAFLHPFFQDRYGFTPLGTFASAVDAEGATLYITWHGRRRPQGWDTCALTVIHIPESERKP